jgi:hypothetical protein
MTTSLSDNTNLFQPTAFQVSIDRKQFGNFQFYVQRVQHPGASNPVAEVPFRNYASAPMPGGQLQYGDLTMDVLLDEDFNAYNEMYDWIVRLAHVEQIRKRDNFAGKTSDHPTHCDIVVTALTNQNNKNKRITYHDAIPHTIGDISFEATNAGVEYISFPVSFRFTYFVIEKMTDFT